MLLSLYALIFSALFLLTFRSLRAVDGNPWPETAMLAFFVAVAWPLTILVWLALAIESKRQERAGEG